MLRHEIVIKKKHELTSQVRKVSLNVQIIFKHFKNHTKMQEVIS